MANAALDREIERYLARTPKSRALQAEATEVLPGGSSRGTAYFAPYPFFAEGGEGHYVYDVDGNRYVDFMLNATSLILGHAHPAVVESLGAQAARGTAFSTPTVSQVRLARLLRDRIPSLDTVRFTNSGTEGTLMAIRAARAFTGRPKLAKFEGGYHGAHEHVAVSVHPPADRLDPRGPTPIAEHPGQPASVLQDVVVLPYNDLEACERLLRAHAAELACLIMEPIVSSFGYVPGRPEFLHGLRKLTEELGIVLIYDEVQSLRVAPGGAQELFGINPDLTCLGKIIGGGLPVGAFGGRRDIMALFDPTGPGARIAHAGTFNANPMTMVAGEVVMRTLTPDVYRRLAALGETVRGKLRTVFAEAGVAAQVTGVASLFGIHFTADPITSYRTVLAADETRRKTLFTGLLNEGVLLQTTCAGALGVMTTETEIEALIAAMRRVLARMR
jgi:glutamate-1-semialdehyde 2,1-aminomutase